MPLNPPSCSSWLPNFDSQILKLTPRSTKSTYTGHASNLRGPKTTLRALKSGLKLTLRYQNSPQRSKMIPKFPNRPSKPKIN